MAVLSLVWSWIPARTTGLVVLSYGGDLYPEIVIFFPLCFFSASCVLYHVMCDGGLNLRHANWGLRLSSWHPVEPDILSLYLYIVDRNNARQRVGQMR